MTRATRRRGALALTLVLTAAGGSGACGDGSAVRDPESADPAASANGAAGAGVPVIGGASGRCPSALGGAAEVGGTDEGGCRAALAASGAAAPSASGAAAVAGSAGVDGAAGRSGASLGSGARGGAGSAAVAGAAGGEGGGASFSLHGAPLTFAPTDDSFGINVILAAGDPARLLARSRARDSGSWSDAAPPVVTASDVAQWTLTELSPSTAYEYEILTQEGESLFVGSARTRRAAGEGFTFALLADSHIGSDLTYENQGDPEILRAVAADVLAAAPDFMIHLGDVLDFHQQGYDVPLPNGSIARQAYLNYRALLGATAGQVAHFSAIGNWDGENGEVASDAIERSREQRLLYLPNPDAATYPEGGADTEDYYAFTWGDALFIVLNVMTYTTTPHLGTEGADAASSWTLGDAQLAWLQRTLEGATSRWRFVLIHHPVGGAGPREDYAVYGRGGGLAADVGEQAVVHQLLRAHGVQAFFYGHDHTFTDQVVDDIHYTMPGSAGAIWRFTAEDVGYDPEATWVESGFGRVSVSPDRVEVQFVREGGEVLYAYRIE